LAENVAKIRTFPLLVTVTAVLIAVEKLVPVVLVPVCPRVVELPEIVSCAQVGIIGITDSARATTNGNNL
jgi:hypothetical protein